MPVNDFEKQVQEKMDELIFAPSETVWPAVEKQIAVRKKRRVLFIWLLFPALLLGGAAWYFSGARTVNKKEINGKSSIAASKNNDKKDNSTSPVVAHKTTMGQGGLKDSLINESTTEKIASTKVKDGESIKEKSDTVSKNNEQADAAGTIVLGNTNKDEKNKMPVVEAAYVHKAVVKTNSPIKNHKKPGNNAISETVVAEKDMAVAETPSADKTANNAETKSANNKDIISDKPLADLDSAVTSMAVAKASGNDSTQKANKGDSVAAVAKNKNKSASKKKIEWGINLNAGASSVSDGFSGLFSTSQSYNISAFSSAPNNNTGNGNTGVTAAPPSAVHSGFSFAAGVFMSKPLGKNVHLLAGLNYNYYSTYIDVGLKLNTNTTSFTQYNTGSSTGYTNRFHFIEIPVTIEKRFGKTSRFSLNGGLSFSYLAGTNALLYDAQKNIYTADKSLINKFQVGLIGGFSYRLFPKSSLPLQIGPQFNYGLGNIFNKDLYGSRHLLFGGINIKLYLHKNK